MKRLVALLGIFAVTIFLGVLLTIAGEHTAGQEKQQNMAQVELVTSFEPVYVIVSRLTEGSDYYQVSKLTGTHTGCLHDYQLTTDNMKQLETAELFFINGGGMEGFLEEAAKNYPKLAICNISENLEAGDIHEHDEATEPGELHEHDEHSGAEAAAGSESAAESEKHEHSHEWNAHFWMNPEQYLLQIDTAARFLAKKDPERASLYQENAKHYKEEVAAIGEQMKEKLGGLSQAKVISFHEAFEPLAEYLDVRILKMVDLDGEIHLSAGEIAQIVRLIKEENISYVWMEKSTNKELMDTVIRETQVHVIELDALTGQPQDEKNAYLDGMLSNILALEEMTEADGS